MASELARRGLPASYADDLNRHLVPLLVRLTERLIAADHGLLVGLCGCQGAGKSTLAGLLAGLIAEVASLSCQVVHLDDFYLSRAERLRLAREVHPLLATRGVPGTHDLILLQGVLDGLLDRRGQAPVTLPSFDKLADDRLPPTEWPSVPPRADLVILEGWCVGCRPQAENDLAAPINALEAEHDPRGRWRRFVNDQLAGAYGELFAALDLLVLMVPPDIGCVLSWRLRQEQRLAEAGSGEGRVAMTRSELEVFVSHFERLTRFMLLDLPGSSDAQILLDRQQRPIACRGPLVS